MAYIGKLPVVGNFQVCDAISVVNGQAAYTMQVASTDISPQSANHMLVSLNGVLQKPGSSYTVSGATITFASNLVTNDVIDFIQVLGDVLNTGTPSDGAVLTAGLAANAVTGAKLNTDVISAQTALAAAPADTDEFLVSDAGVLKRIDYSLIKGGGGLVHLSTTTVTATDVSAISFDGLFTSDYTHYKFIYSIRGATNNTDTAVRIRQSNSDITASNYWYAGMAMYRANGSTTANTAGANATGYIRISSADNTNNAAYPTTGELILFNPLSTAVNKTITTTNLGYNSNTTPNAIRVWTFGGQLVDTTAASGLSFLYDGGNIMGTVSLYGIVNS